MKSVCWVVAVLLLGFGQSSGSEHARQAAERLVSLGIAEAAARALMERWIGTEADEDPEALVAVLERASEVGAPVGLVANKAAEGLAKSMPRGRLLEFLGDFGVRLAQAARMARAFQDTLGRLDVPEDEAVLRLWALQRTREDDGWLRRMASEGPTRRAGLREFLRICEAIDDVRELGMEEKKAEDLGILWLQEHMKPDDVGTVLRAIRARQAWLEVSEAASMATDCVLQGMSTREVLKSMQEGRMPEDQRTRP